MKKNNSYLVTRILFAIFIVAGLILAAFPGIYVKTTAFIVDGKEVFFEAFIPTYQSIFGGNIETNLVLQQNSLDFKDNAIVNEMLQNPVSLNIHTNILVTIFFVLSLIATIVFVLYAKSRIASLITTIILVITTITFATSDLTFNMSCSSELIQFASGYELSLGMMFLVLSYSIATTIAMFHLFRILIKPNSLQSGINQNLKD